MAETTRGPVQLVRRPTPVVARISLDRCASSRPAAPLSAFDGIMRNVTGTCMVDVVRDMRDRVFRVLPRDAQESAEMCLDVLEEPMDMPEAKASPRLDGTRGRMTSVALQRCASAPAASAMQAAGATKAVLPASPGSAPTSPLLTSARASPLQQPERPQASGQPPAKKHSPSRTGMLYKCALCGLATFSELELNDDGDAFVHKNCGMWVQNAPGISLDRERNCRAEDDGSEAARAERTAERSAPFYATLRDKCSTAHANATQVGNGSKRTGIALAQKLATEDAARREHGEWVVKSREASRLRQVLKKIAEVLDTQREADRELLSASQATAERLFVQSVHRNASDDLMQYSSLMVAVTCVRREIAERAADRCRRSAPSFNRMQRHFASKFPDGFQGAPMQEKAVALLANRILGEFETPQKMQRSPSRATTVESSAADNSADVSSVSASVAHDQDDCFF